MPTEYSNGIIWAKNIPTEYSNGIIWGEIMPMAYSETEKYANGIFSKVYAITCRHRYLEGVSPFGAKFAARVYN